VGMVLKIVLAFAVALFCALVAVVGVAVAMLKEGERNADAEAGSEDPWNEALAPNRPESVQRRTGLV
jgi:hypothetical protein